MQNEGDTFSAISKLDQLRTAKTKSLTKKKKRLEIFTVKKTTESLKQFEEKNDVYRREKEYIALCGNSWYPWNLEVNIQQSTLS